MNILVIALWMALTGVGFATVTDQQEVACKADPVCAESYWGNMENIPPWPKNNNQGGRPPHIRKIGY